MKTDDHGRFPGGEGGAAKFDSTMVPAPVRLYSNVLSTRVPCTTFPAIAVEHKWNDRRRIDKIYTARPCPALAGSASISIAFCVSIELYRLGEYTYDPTCEAYIDIYHMHRYWSMVPYE